MRIIRLFSAMILLSFTPLATLVLQAQLRTWSTEDIPATQFKKIIVLGLNEDLLTRDKIEGELAKAAHKKGLLAVEGILMFPPELGKPIVDFEQTRANLRSKGFDGLITVTLIGTSAKRYIPPSSTYEPLIYYNRFGNYYTRTYALVHTGGYEVQDIKYFLEVNLFELEEGRLIWSGRSYAFEQEAMNSSLGSFAKKLFKELRNLGLIPK